MWKVDKEPNELSDLAKEVFRQIIEGAAWFSFLLLIVKCRRTEI